MEITGVASLARKPDPTVLAAFAVIYLVWGSTYLAIKIAITSLPPFTMTAIRSVVAGAILYAWGRCRGGSPPTLGQWGTGALVGGLLFGIGHGGLSWAEQRVPSGAASLFIATLPVWMTLLQLATDRERGLPPRTMVGVGAGSVGVLVLVGPSTLLGRDPIDLLGGAVLVVSAVGWAVGSAVARRVPHPASLTITTGSYLLTGGAVLGTLALVSGERFDPAATTLTSLAALAYLITFGSVVAFGAYSWLLRRQPLSAVSTYAFVNPVVALAMGWAFGGEVLNGRILGAATFVLAAVVLILTGSDPSHAPGRQRSMLVGRSRGGRSVRYRESEGS